jgi:hypothetical protein
MRHFAPRDILFITVFILYVLTVAILLLPTQDSRGSWCIANSVVYQSQVICELPSGERFYCEGIRLCPEELPK